MRPASSTERLSGMISQNKIKPTARGVNKPILLYNTWTSPTLRLGFALCGEGAPGCLSCQGTVHASAAPILFLSTWPQHSPLPAPPVPAIGIPLFCLAREHAGGWGVCVLCLVFGEVSPDRHIQTNVVSFPNHAFGRCLLIPELKHL